MNLDKGWMFLGCEPQTDNVEDINMPDIGSSSWLKIDVPGDVNAALLEHKKMPDPRYDTQARECYWVTSKEWWYKLIFDFSEDDSENIDICFESIDGPADIWLNDKYLGTAENSFRAFRLNTTGLLKTTENRLLIRFKSIDKLLGSPRIDELAGWLGRRTFIRKPQFSFGWDWSLPLPSIGLAGPVYLEINNEKKFADFSVRTFCDGRVDFAFEVTKTAKDIGYIIRVSLKGHGADLKHEIAGVKLKPYSGHGANGSVKPSARYKSYCTLNIADPKLWFPNGYGDQPLYDYSAELVVEGRVTDTSTGRIGLRECRIVERPFTREAGHGYSFEIELNGQTIFCKGANWVPLEIWPGIAKEEQYEFYLRKAKEVNFNMLRVWGGGIYERKIFYELCDELGIMVWQDFMFASSGYPVDILRKEIIKEADYQIKRLRNHCSIVLWCGCNEDIFSWAYPGEIEVSAQQDTGVYSEICASDKKWLVDRLKDDPQIYSMILRGMVSLLGQGVPYVESSPESQHEDCGNIPSSRNCHISCWKYALLQSQGHPENFRQHFEQVCSFDSEFCVQGPCREKAIRTFMAPKNHWPPNESWEYHIQTGHKNIPHHEQTISIAGAIFGKIDTLQKYVKYGQATHAEMMRAEFESARRDRPNNGGTMVWMFNDCWPTSNWSIIDYYRSEKPSFYAAKRSCSPLLPIIMERSGRIEFFFGNDTLKTIDVQLRYGQEKLTGENVWSKKKKLTIKPNSSTKFYEILKKEIKIPLGDYIYIDTSSLEKKLDRVIYFPNGWKNISWPMPHIEISCKEQSLNHDRWYALIKLRTDNFARFCHLLWKGHPMEISFSDNYFDMSAGETKELVIQSKEKIDINDLKIGHWLTQWE